MKRIRQCLALALMLCLLLGALPAHAAFTDDDEIDNKEAISMLVILGVISGYDDGSFRPSVQITRAEISKMLCVMINGGKDPGLMQPQQFTFTDIADKWAARYIEYVASIGIVSGYGDGRFGPDDGVTGQHLSKMLLVSLNYDPEVEGLTGAKWAENVDRLAEQLGLYAELGESFDSTQPLTREQTAQILANALYVDRAMYNYSDETGVVSGTQKNSSFMENNFNAEVKTGIVTANSAGWLNQSARDASRDGGDVTVVDTGLYAGEPSAMTLVATKSGMEVLGTAVTVVVRRDTGEAYGYLDAGVNSVARLATSADRAQTDAFLAQQGLTMPDSLLLCVNGRMAGEYSGNSAGEVTRFVDYNGDGAVDVALMSRPYVTTCMEIDGELELAAIPATGEDRFIFDPGVRAGEPVLCEVYGGACHVRPCRKVSGVLEGLTPDMKTITVGGVSYTPSSLQGAVALGEEALVSGSLTLYLDDSGYFVLAEAY